MKRLILFVICCIVLSLTIVGIVLYRTRTAPIDLLTPITDTLFPHPSPSNGPFIVYGYLPYWTAKTAQLPSTLTHVSFFSLGIQEDGSLISPAANSDNGYRMYTNGYINELAEKLNSSQAIELTITMMDQDIIMPFLENDEARQRFIKDLDTVLASYPKIRGVNIDVEYIRSVEASNQAQLTSLVRSVYLHLKEKDPTFHVSIAVMGDSGQRARLTSPKDLAPVVDHIIVMAYDYHRRGSQQSGPNAPLYGEGEEQWGKNIMAGFKAFTDVVPPDKLILGIPFYGYEWSVSDTNVYNFTLPSTGQTATYERIQKLLSSGQAKRHWDPTSLSPYIFYQKNGKQQQIYYDDPESLAYKLDLVKQAHLGGIALWALGYEGDTNEMWQTIDDALQ